MSQKVIEVKDLAKKYGDLTAVDGITFDVYGHLMPGGEEEARERVDAYLDHIERGPHLRAVGD